MLYKSHQLGIEVWTCIFRDRNAQYKKITGLCRESVLSRAMIASGKTADEITGGYTISAELIKEIQESTDK